MTNHLNSVLFEGIVSDKPDFNGNSTLFSLVNHMFTENNGKKTEHFTSLPVFVEGDLAEPAFSQLKMGMTVRCVGKLLKVTEEPGKTKVVIIAQHIEYKSDSMKSKGEVIENN